VIKGSWLIFYLGSYGYGILRASYALQLLDSCLLPPFKITCSSFEFLSQFLLSKTWWIPFFIIWLSQQFARFLCIHVMFDNQSATFVQRSQNSKKQHNCIWPAQATILHQTPNHQPYSKQEAEKYKGQYNLVSKLVTIVIAQQCNHQGFWVII